MTDEFMFRRFDLRRYNCWDLTREVWLRLTGQDLGSLLLGNFSAAELQKSAETESTRYKEIEKPQSPCIVLMQRPRHIPHVGVFWQGRVLHIRRAGVQYTALPVASLGFTSVRFYVPCAQ